MEQANDQWLWFVDDELVAALARHDVVDPQSNKRAVLSVALVKALSFNMEGKTEQALREIRTAIESGEALPELDWTKAHLEFQLGQYAEALEDYEKVLAAYPNHRAGIYNSALCLEKLGRFEQAAEAFRKTAQMSPNLAEARLGLGICQLHLERREEALAAFEECLKVKPAYDNALYGKAVALQLLGRLEEASQLYTKLLPANGANAELLTNMVALALAQADDGKVREYCEKLLK